MKNNINQINVMNKYEIMSVNEFDKFINKRIKIEYHDNPNIIESKKCIIGTIEKNIHAVKREIREENRKIIYYVPLSFNFLIEENNQSINIYVKDLINIEYLE